MKNYSTPLLEILLFQEFDIIRTSVFGSEEDSTNDNLGGAPDDWA